MTGAACGFPARAYALTMTTELKEARCPIHRRYLGRYKEWGEHYCRKCKAYYIFDGGIVSVRIDDKVK